MTGQPTAPRRRTAAHLLFAASFLLAGLAVFAPASQGPSPRPPSSAFTRSVTATRVFVDQDGTETAAGSHDVTLSVSQTDHLRGRQEVKVTWDGAIPTGGVVGDPNSSDGRLQEYPFVLLQCRGVDTAGEVPAGQVRLGPETCWTQTSAERYLATASHTPAWRFDAYAAEGDRQPVVGAPDPLPEECAGLSQPLTARWLPFRAAGGEVYYGGPDPGVGCIALAPESDSAEGEGLPSNTTYGITGTDGRGETDFAVWTAAENASLGCTSDGVSALSSRCRSWGSAVMPTAPGCPLGPCSRRRRGMPLTEAQLAEGGQRRAAGLVPTSPASHARAR